MKNVSSLQSRAEQPKHIHSTDTDIDTDADTCAQGQQFDHAAVSPRRSTLPVSRAGARQLAWHRAGNAMTHWSFVKAF